MDFLEGITDLPLPFVARCAIPNGLAAVTAYGDEEPPEAVKVPITRETPINLFSAGCSPIMRFPEASCWQRWFAVPGPPLLSLLAAFLRSALGADLGHLV